MGAKVGRLASVKLGTYKVAEMGVWSLNGINIDMLDSSEFGDEFRTYEMGMGDYGTLSFSGWWDMGDENGQAVLDSAHRNKSKISEIRFYVDNTSYYTPDITNVTDAGILVQSMRIDFDKAGLGRIEFTAQCTGPMALV